MWYFTIIFGGIPFAYVYETKKAAQSDYEFHSQNTEVSVIYPVQRLKPGTILQLAKEI